MLLPRSEPKGIDHHGNNYESPLLLSIVGHLPGQQVSDIDWVLDGFPDEVNGVAEKIYADFNEMNGTDYKFQLEQ